MRIEDRIVDMNVALESTSSTISTFIAMNEHFYSVRGSVLNGALNTVTLSLNDKHKEVRFDLKRSNILLAKVHNARALVWNN